MDGAKCCEGDKKFAAQAETKATGIEGIKRDTGRGKEKRECNKKKSKRKGHIVGKRTNRERVGGGGNIKWGAVC